MQISDLMNSYQNMLAAGGGKVPEGTKGVEQLVSTLAKLQVGQIFEGTVNSVKGSEVILGLSSGQNITARLDKGVSVDQGESVFFQVKKNDGKTISIQPVSIGSDSSNPALGGALRAAQIPQTEATVKMVDEMMKNQMSIDTKSLTDMARLVAGHPDADVADIVTLKQQNLPVTDEMLSQLANYKEGQGALLTGLSGLSDAIAGAFEGEGESLQMAGEFLNKVTDILYEGEETTIQAEPTVEGKVVSETGLSGGQAKLETVPGSEQQQPSVETGTFKREEVIASSISDQPVSDGSIRADHPMGSVGRALTEETFTSLAKTLREDPEFKEKYPNLFDEKGNLKKDAPVKELLLSINDHVSSSPEKLKKLVASGDMKELLTAAFSEKYTLEPRELKEKGSIDDMYKKLSRDMQKISEAVKEFPPIAQPVQQAAQEVRNNLDFISQVNQMYEYIQLPLKLSGQDATGDLYVYANKKKAKEETDEVTAFLHFDMEHLGSTDISVKLRGKNVDTQFYMADDASYDLIANNIHILEHKLEELGYNCRIGVESGGKPVNFVEDFLKKDAPTAKNASLLRYSFDVRA